MWIYTSNSHMYSRYPQGQFCVFFLWRSIVQVLPVSCGQ
jgi:hypothetical protein